MLQVSTGKFFKHEAYETLRRATYYTNYRMFRDERLETRVGSLQPVIGAHGLGALTCEIIERTQKQPGGPYPGETIATGGDTLINDFAAVVSFALDVTCTTDVDLPLAKSSQIGCSHATVESLSGLPRLLARARWSTAACDGGPADAERLVPRSRSHVSGTS